MWKIYDYHCTECGAVVERLVKNDEVPECQECGIRMERMLSAPVYHQDIVSYLEANGRSVPCDTIPPKPFKEI